MDKRKTREARPKSKAHGEANARKARGRAAGPSKVSNLVGKAKSRRIRDGSTPRTAAPAKEPSTGGMGLDSDATRDDEAMLADAMRDLASELRKVLKDAHDECHREAAEWNTEADEATKLRRACWTAARCAWHLEAFCHGVDDWTIQRSDPIGSLRFRLLPFLRFVVHLDEWSKIAWDARRGGSPQVVEHLKKAALAEPAFSWGKWSGPPFEVAREFAVARRMNLASALQTTVNEKAPRPDLRVEILRADGNSPDLLSDDAIMFDPIRFWENDHDRRTFKPTPADWARLDAQLERERLWVSPQSPDSNGDVKPTSPTMRDLASEAGISDDTFRRVRRAAWIKVKLKGAAARNRRYPPSEVDRLIAAALAGNYIERTAMAEKWAQWGSKKAASKPHASK